MLVPSQRPQHAGLLLVPASLQVLMLQGGWATGQMVTGIGAVLPMTGSEQRREQGRKGRGSG